MYYSNESQNFIFRDPEEMQAQSKAQCVESEEQEDILQILERRNSWVIVPGEILDDESVYYFDGYDNVGSSLGPNTPEASKEASEFVLDTFSELVIVLILDAICFAGFLGYVLRPNEEPFVSELRTLEEGDIAISEQRSTTYEITSNIPGYFPTAVVFQQSSTQFNNELSATDTRISERIATDAYKVHGTGVCPPGCLGCSVFAEGDSVNDNVPQSSLGGSSETLPFPISVKASTHNPEEEQEPLRCHSGCFSCATGLHEPIDSCLEDPSYP